MGDLEQPILVCRPFNARWQIERRPDSEAFDLLEHVPRVRSGGLGMMLWFAAHRGPVGHTAAFDGPFDIFLAFAHVLLPLGVLELHLAAGARGGARAKGAMAALLLVLSLATAVGVLLVAMGMWLPRL